MSKKIKKMSDYQLGELGKKYNEQVQKDSISSLKKSIDQGKILTYAMNTYVIPHKIQKEPISKQFLELFDEGKFNSNKDIDDFFKKNMKSEPVEAWFDDYPKKKESKTANKIKKLIDQVDKTKILDKTENKNKNSIQSIMDMVSSLIKQPKQKQYPDIEESVSEMNKLLNAPKKSLKKLVKADKEHIKYHPSKQDKEELKLDKDILLQPYKYKNLPLIDQIAESLQNPEFEGMKKKKIIDSYSFDTITKFNTKYHDLMLKLFKSEEAIEKVLSKKASKLQKNILSENKKKERLLKYAEAKKEERKVKKIEKTKHLRDLTPEEHKKFLQARNYYMRKSKTSDILPKNLNKEDPESLNTVCRQLAIDNFSTMSEQLFMKEYEG
jgi:hypothetical protein